MKVGQTTTINVALHGWFKVGRTDLLGHDLAVLVTHDVTFSISDVICGVFDWRLLLQPAVAPHRRLVAYTLVVRLCVFAPAPCCESRWRHCLFCYLQLRQFWELAFRQKAAPRDLQDVFLTILNPDGGPRLPVLFQFPVQDDAPLSDLPVTSTRRPPRKTCAQACRHVPLEDSSA